MADKISPADAIRAGNRTMVMVEARQDPVRIALHRWNTDVALAHVPRPVSAEEPLVDGKAYPVEGAPQPLCRPFVKLAWRGGLLPGPELRFEQRDDDLHLTAVFEEDSAKRAPGAVPFTVRLKSVSLRFGADASDVLAFPAPLQEPHDSAAGPAFRIEADAVVPRDERRARLVSALQTKDAATWQIEMEFEWLSQAVAPPAPPAPPGGVRVVDRLDAARVGLTVRDHRAASPAARQFVAAGRVRDRAASFDALRLRPGPWRPQRPPPPPPPQVKVIAVSRHLAAWYPLSTADNRVVFAAVTGDYAQAGWQSSAHGWFQPTPIQDTVYCLPDAYRLEVDLESGRPAVHALLLRQAPGSTAPPTDDPALYTIRLTMTARPDFAADRLGSLRRLIRAQSEGEIPHADLVLGGYAGARFQADDSLAGLGTLFAGRTAEDREDIDPAGGFSVTYEGKAELIDLVLQRLKDQGIRGGVEFDLQEPGGAVRKHTVPVVLTLRRPAPVMLPWELVARAPAPEPPAEEPGPGEALDRPEDDAVPPRVEEIRIRNASPLAIAISGIEAFALEKSPVTRRVNEAHPAAPIDVTFPLSLPAGGSTTVQLRVDDGMALVNAWDVALVDARPEVPAETLFGSLLDAATSSVRGWAITVECPTFEFLDQLSDQDKARMQGVVGLEVEVRRGGGGASEEVKLSKQVPRAPVLLSRTVADFVSDRATGRTQFEYRTRVIRMTRADEWTAWKSDSGNGLTVFPF